MIITKGFGIGQMLTTQGYGTHIHLITLSCRIISIPVEDRMVIIPCVEQ